ncbi:MAG: nitrate reductase, partial [Thioalkalispiraceae bacterium]
MIKTVKTTCPYCGVGCGIIVSQDLQGNYDIKGDPEHPANNGLLCSKGSALSETLSRDGRLLSPQVSGKSTSWENAVKVAATGLMKIIEEYGPDAVAFYVSGQLLTEDYYVANKLMKGFIGSGNIDTNSRLCMSSAVAGYKRAFGSDTVPCCYEDLERAKLLVIVGSNTAWCHPVVYQRIVKAKKENPDLFVVVIDPRKTATEKIADQYLAIKPGTDQVLFSGLFKSIVEQDEADNEYVQSHTEGINEIPLASLPDIDAVAEQCQIPAEQIEQFYRLFARTDRVVTLYSQGINQWSYGTDRVNAIINVHLLTGRIGRPGMGPFSITGQPNAMGGREVGGLANQLAAHMDINNEQHHQRVSEFWQTDRLTKSEGFKAVELFDEVNEGNVKAIWIMATNPAVSLPGSSKVREALQKCELVIVSDCMQSTDTTQYADILFPAQTWGERDGTVTNSERCISRQRPFLRITDNARPDWWIICQIASKMGYQQAFDYQSPREIFTEHARLSGWYNAGTRDFDISALAELDQNAYDILDPVQWPVTRQYPQGSKRLFTEGKFFTPSGRARFISSDNNLPASRISVQYPFILNTGRTRDHWHTMTRTAKSARLATHSREPFVEIHPDDALRSKIEANSLVKVTSRDGELVVRARITQTQRNGEVFIPIHWNDQFSANACVAQLLEANVDPVSGQPEFKHTPVQLEPIPMSCYGYIISRRELGNIKTFDYWTRINCDNMICYEIASITQPDDWTRQARALLCHESGQPEWIEYYDAAQGRYRAARIDGGRLDSFIFIGPDKQLPDKSWLINLFKQDGLANQDRTSILAGSSGSPIPDKGEIICSCFSVGI